MSRLAPDWSDWASRCESRETPEQSAPEVLTLRMDCLGREVVCERIAVATGEPVLADLLPFRR